MRRLSGINGLTRRVTSIRSDSSKLRLSPLAQRRLRHREQPRLRLPRNYRYATTTPITAVFDQSKFTTTYTFNTTGLFPQGGLIRWSGPNCGTVSGDAFSVASIQRYEDLAVKAPYTWVHPHPPCGDSPDHADATIVGTLAEGEGHPERTPRFITTCTYRGSATGTGAVCETRQETR